MVDKSTARVLGTLYIALTTALSREGIELANDVLLDVANSPRTSDAEAEVYRIIAASAGMTQAQVKKVPRFELIAGGAA